nr:YceI family protein [uncultured Chitinophaga sp.]
MLFVGLDSTKPGLESRPRSLVRIILRHPPHDLQSGRQVPGVRRQHHRRQTRLLRRLHKRDNHLKSSDFLHAEQFPRLSFQSTAFRRITEGRYQLEGDLTIRDVTRRVKFNVTYGGITSEGKKQSATFKATTYINRFDYNLQWDKLTEAGGMVVDKMVSIMLKLEFVKQ